MMRDIIDVSTTGDLDYAKRRSGLEEIPEIR